MDTVVAFEKDGVKYNSIHERLFECELCDGLTTMGGTRRCDRCWELESRIEADLELAISIIDNKRWRHVNEHAPVQGQDVLLWNGHEYAIGFRSDDGSEVYFISSISNATYWTYLPAKTPGEK